MVLNSHYAPFAKENFRLLPSLTQPAGLTGYPTPRSFNRLSPDAVMIQFLTYACEIAFSMLITFKYQVISFLGFYLSGEK